MREVYRSTFHFRGIGGLAVWCAAVWTATPVEAATVITEMTSSPLTLDAVTWPSFVELHIGDRFDPFDLLIVDGRPGMERRIVRRITVDPAGADLVVVHEGLWPVTPAPTVRTIGVDQLDLIASASGAWPGTSRWLVVSDEVQADWPDGGWVATTIDQWPGIDDTLGFYRGTGWSIDPAVGRTAFALPDGGAIARHRSVSGEWLDGFSVGRPDGQGLLPDGYTLTPGLVNPIPFQIAPPVLQPEPTTLIVMMLAGTLTCLSRRRRNHITRRCR